MTSRTKETILKTKGEKTVRIGWWAEYVAAWHVHRVALDIALIAQVPIDTLLAPESASTGPKGPRGTSRLRAVLAWVACQMHDIIQAEVSRSLDLDNATVSAYRKRVDDAMEDPRSFERLLLEDIFDNPTTRL